MSFPEYDVIRRTRKGNFLKQIDQLIDWNPIEKAIAIYYAPVSDAAGRPARQMMIMMSTVHSNVFGMEYDKPEIRCFALY